MVKIDKPITEGLDLKGFYLPNRFNKDIKEWRENLKKVIRTTGSTNFELLQQNEFFRSFFPFVTSSDKMVIHKLLSELKRLRK